MPNYETDNHKRRFLQAILRGDSVSLAARYAGVHRTLPYHWAKADSDFAQSWQEAGASQARLALAIDTVFDLAIAGNVHLLKFLIDRFDRHRGRGAGPVPDDTTVTPRIQIFHPDKSDTPPDSADVESVEKPI